MSRLSLYLLGAPRIERGGAPVQVNTRKAIALLAYLALTAESHGRDALVNLLWPEADQIHGRTALRSTLYVLRKALAGPSPAGKGATQVTWLNAERETIGLDPQAQVWLDVGQFHRHLCECQVHGHPAADVCPDCLPPLTAAVALYRGDFMSGFSLKDSFNFDDWQFFQAESLRREFGVALERLVRCHIAQAAFEPAIRYARQWLALDRLNEAAHCQLMRLYAWSGHRPAALRQYQECVQVLESQLGVLPQETTGELYQAIAAGRVPVPPDPGSSALEQGRPAVSVPEPALRSETTRLVTVLLADVSRPSVRDGDAGPEEEATRIDAWLGAMQEVAARYGTQVEPTLAGRILAVFGAARMREADPELAIRAALEALQEAETLGLSLRAGISTGEAYLRQGRAERGTGHTWAGRAISLAAHLAGQARGGQILVAPSTYHLTRQAFAFTPCAVEISGQDGQGEAYQVDRLLPQARKTRGMQALSAALIGRDEELARLKSALAQVLRGQGQMVSLIGEAGVGKSRLVAELNAAATGSGAAAPAPLWLEGRCLELGTAASYAPFVDILRQILSWGAREADRRRYERVTATLQGMAERGDLAPERADEISAVLGHLFSLPISDEWRERLANEDPQQLSWHRSAAIRDFLVALCRQRPVVLVLEDLHWADSLSVGLIVWLMEALPRAPLLLLCVYRPERTHRCWHLATVAAQKCRECYVEIVLRELTHQQSRTMLESLLATGDLPPSMREGILNRAQGNPFFIEEVARALIDAGIVRQESSAWQARGDVGLAAIPYSVQSVILSRVDHLDPKLKQVLQVAAVMGRAFRQRVLAHALGQEIALEQALWDLEERALIYQERSVPEVEYAFKHVLTQEAVYQSIVDSRRKELHGQVAGAIEALYRDSLDEYDEQLAHHYEQGGDVEKAVGYLLKAGEKAKRSYANEEAIAHLSRGLALLRTLPPTSGRDRRELDLQLALGVVLVHVRGHAASEVAGAYTRAQELCERAGSASQRLQTLTGLRRSRWARGELRTAKTLGRQLLAVAQNTGDPLDVVWACMMQGETLYRLGEFPQSWEQYERGLGLCEGLPHRVQIAFYGNDPRVASFGATALTLWHLGYPDRALAMGHEGLEHARALSHPFVLVFALYCDGVTHQLRREARAVHERADALLRIAQQRAFPLYVAWGTILHGWALAQEGLGTDKAQVAQGMGEMRQGIAACRAIQVGATLPSWLASLAQACGQVGEVEEALSLLDEALALAGRNEERCWEAEVHRLRGDLLLGRGEPDQAEAAFQRALDVARGQSARAWELRAAMSVGRLWDSQGRRAEARALLQAIYGWFTEGFGTPDLQEAGALLNTWA